jgi:hypothetical protein
MMAIVGEYKGEIVIIDDWSTGFNEPIRFRTYWPVGVSAKDYSFLIGKQAHYGGGGSYRVDNTTVFLKGGMEARSIYTEEEPLKPPRKTKYVTQWTWYKGSWRDDTNFVYSKMKQEEELEKREQEKHHHIG